MKKFSIILLLILLFPSYVDALTLDCPSIASSGEEVHCQIKGENIKGLKLQYQMDSVFSYHSFQIQAPWKSYYNGVQGFSAGNIGEVSNLEGELVFRVGMDATSGSEYAIKLTKIEEVSLENQLVLKEDVVSRIRIVSDINTLDQIQLSSGSISFKFDKNVTSYQLNVTDEKITIQASASDSSSKIEGDLGKRQLNYGVNVFRIQVTSERGNIREYVLYITRVPKTVSKNDDATLKSLVVNGQSIDLKKDQFYYEMDVDNQITDVEVEAIPNHSSSKVEITNPSSFIVGENQILIQVTAMDGTTCTYVVLVNRKKILSSDASILSLKIQGYEIDFDPTIYQYDLEILKEDKLDIEVKLHDENASYVIHGNQNLTNHSKINIVVTAEDGSQNIYQIRIIKEGEDTSHSILDSIPIVPLIIFVFLGVVIFIIRMIRRRFS